MIDEYFESIDYSFYRPVFQRGSSRETMEAIKYTIFLLKYLSKMAFNDYRKIPHSVSAIISYKDDIRIDIKRTFDSNDPYIKEEALLAPPESKVDRLWRRRVTRLTYLATQLFFALVTGKLPNEKKSTIKSGELSTQHTVSEILYIQKFCAMGLASDIRDRFQNFESMLNELKTLRSKFFALMEAGRTDTNLPQYDNLHKQYQSMLENRGKVQQEEPTKHGYEIFIWIPKYENGYKININIPAQVIIGRKTQPKKSSSLDEQIVTATHSRPKEEKMVLHQSRETKNNIDYYKFYIEGDSCLSRKHVKLDFPADISQTPTFQDLGSTHGVVVYLDSSRTITNSKMLSSGEESKFYSTDQYLQLGNTFIRIRPLEIS